MPNGKRVKICKNIFRIGEYVYVEVSHDRKILRRKAPMQGAAALNSRGKPTAELLKWFREVRDSVQGQEWEKLKASRMRRECPDVETFAAAYRKAAAEEFAATGEPRPETARQNAASLLRLARELGAKRMDELDGDAAARFVETRCRAAPGERARISAWSNIRQARSCWAGWTAPYFRKAGIEVPPCLRSWPGPKRAAGAAYVRPPDPLRQATMAWYSGLEAADPTAWAAATLMLQFAMRPIDASALGWEAFCGEPGKRALRYVPSKTRGRCDRPRQVAWPISEELFARLRAAGGKESVIPGASETARRSIFEERINPAMRGLGWDRARYGKACYELRKLCVDAVYRKLGLERACQISGDNAQTILHYYADPSVEGLAPVDVAEIV